MREAFDYLAERIDTAFDNEIAQLTDSTVEPDRLLERYVDVMSNFVDTPEFFHALEEEGVVIRNRQRLAILLEGQKFKTFHVHLLRMVLQ